MTIVAKDMQFSFFFSFLCEKMTGCKYDTDTVFPEDGGSTQNHNPDSSDRKEIKQYQPAAPAKIKNRTLLVGGRVRCKNTRVVSAPLSAMGGATVSRRTLQVRKP